MGCGQPSRWCFGSLYLHYKQIYLCMWCVANCTVLKYMAVIQLRYIMHKGKVHPPFTALHPHVWVLSRWRSSFNLPPQTQCWISPDVWMKHFKQKENVFPLCMTYLKCLHLAIQESTYKIYTKNDWTVLHWREARKCPRKACALKVILTFMIHIHPRLNKVCNCVNFLAEEPAAAAAWCFFCHFLHVLSYCYSFAFCYC